jgi:hypothetical protein
LNAQDHNDLIARIRGVLGDDLAFQVFGVAQNIAAHWDGPTSAITFMQRLVELHEALRACALDGPIRTAIEAWQGRTRKSVNPVEDVLHLVSGGQPLLEIIDQQVRSLTELRRRLAQPRPRAGAAHSGR